MLTWMRSSVKRLDYPVYSFIQKVIIINELIDLAQSVETEDPIDWGLLSISEHDTYMMIATSVLEQYQTWKEMGDSEKIMLSVILKLIVENFVLNYRLLNGASNG